MHQHLLPLELAMLAAKLTFWWCTVTDLETTPRLMAASAVVLEPHCGLLRFLHRHHRPASGQGSAGLWVSRWP